MSHQVFISYSTRDKEIAAEICAALEERDISCWIAPRNIEGGSDWGEAIVHAIKQARILLLVFSSHANRSEQVKREIALAVGNGLFLLPIRIEDEEPRSSLQYFLSTSHWLDALERPIEPILLGMADTVERALAEPDTDLPQMGELTRMSFAVSDLPDAESEIRAAAKADANKPRRGRGVNKETVASASVKLHSHDEMLGRTGRDQTRIAAPAATLANTPTADTAAADKQVRAAGHTGPQEKAREGGLRRTMTMVLPVWQERFWFSKLAIFLLLAVIVVLLVTRGDNGESTSQSAAPATATSSAASTDERDPVAASEPPLANEQSDSQAAQQTEAQPQQAFDDLPQGLEPPPQREPETDTDDLTAVVPGEQSLDQQARIDRLLLQAQDDMQNQRYISPAGGNALDRFREVLELDPANVSAKVGIRRIARAYILLANEAMDKGHLSRAGSYLQVASNTDPESPDVAQAFRRLSTLQDADQN